MSTPRRNNSQIQMDHDILIKIQTEVGFIRQEIKDLTENTTGRITALEVGKAPTTTTADHETRLRILERWGWKAIGALAALQVGITLYFALRK